MPKFTILQVLFFFFFFFFAITRFGRRAEIAKPNSSSKSESPWKIPLWIFTSVRICSSVAYSTLLFSVALVIKS